MIVRDTFLDPYHILVEAGTLSHEGQVCKDEGLLDVKAEGDDVLDILPAEALTLLHLQVLPEELLVVGQLDNQGDIKHVLRVGIHMNY